MFEHKNDRTVPTDCLEVLDDLIKRYYESLLKQTDVNLKPGDLIKMIELRNKLAPTSIEQEKFWAMLSKIRRETMKQNGSSGKAQENKKSRK